MYSSLCLQVLSAAGDHNLRKFSNLSHLHIRVLNYFSWDALPTILQNAPNLKILVLKKVNKLLSCDYGALGEKKTCFCYLTVLLHVFASPGF